MNQNAWMSELKDQLLRLPTEELGAVAARELISEQVAQWAEDRGLDARQGDAEPFTGQKVDVILDSPSGRTLAVMVDDHYSAESLEVLRACKRNDWGVLWIRFDDPIDPQNEGIATMAVNLPHQASRPKPPYPREKTLRVACPVCGQPSGRSCSGTDLDKNGFHERRVKSAKQVDEFIADILARYAKTPAKADT